MKEIAFAFLLSRSVAFADFTSSEVSYRNGSIYFEIEKSKSTFVVSSEHTSHEVKIKECNEKLINDFWQELVGQIGSIRNSSTPQNRLPASKVWLTYEGIEFNLLPSEPKIEYLDRVYSNAELVLVESRRVCKGK